VSVKHLKSSLRDLRQLFDRGVTVRHLAEPFASFDAERLVAQVRDFMEAKNFDVVGVRRNGTVVGYVHRVDLQDGALEHYLRPFEQQLLLDEWTPILQVLRLLTESPRVFVAVMGEVSGIITKGDLQKIPVRMWLFGIISLLEMQFLRLIRAAYPQDSWKALLSSPDRLTKPYTKLVRDFYAEAPGKNAHEDAADKIALDWGFDRECQAFLREDGSPV